MQVHFNEAADLLPYDWQTLLAEAEAQYREYFDVVVERTPEDPRVREMTAIDGAANA